MWAHGHGQHLGGPRRGHGRNHQHPRASSSPPWQGHVASLATSAGDGELVGVLPILAQHVGEQPPPGVDEPVADLGGERRAALSASSSRAPHSSPLPCTSFSHGSQRQSCPSRGCTWKPQRRLLPACLGSPFLPAPSLWLPMGRQSRVQLLHPPSTSLIPNCLLTELPIP